MARITNSMTWNKLHACRHVVGRWRREAGRDPRSHREFGYHAVENVCHARDLHATLLHLLGIDHRRFTFKHQGLDFKLTGVQSARVLNAILT